MYDFDFDPETNGIELSWRDMGSEIPRREARPVYAEELNTLGMDRRWRYDAACPAPLMWAINSVYYYRGRKVMKTTGGTCATPPEITVFEDPEPAGVPLQMCDITGMSARNRPLLDRLQALSVEFTRKVYADYKDRADVFYVAFSGGKDSIATLDVVQRALPHDAFKVVFGDTQMEFPDTYRLVDTVEASCRAAGIDFIRAKSEQAPADTWRVFGPPAEVRRWCCSVHKTTPQILTLRQITSKSDFTGVALCGVRHAESARRSTYKPVTPSAKHKGQIAAYPIIDWSSAEVYLYIYAYNLPMNDAYKKGNRRAGCLVCPMAGGSRDWITDTDYPDAVKPFRAVIADMYSQHYTGTELQHYITEGWKYRRDGRDLPLEPGYAEYKKDGALYIIVSGPKTPWSEWIKTIGVLLFDKSPYKILFRGKVYTFEIEETKQGYKVKTAEKNRVFLKYLKHVFRRAACCIGCHECEADCHQGCITFTGRAVHISDKCRHCAECHKADDGCLHYKSIVKAKVKDAECCKCGAVVDYNAIGLNKRLIGRNTRRFMCLHCLAEFFGTSESALQHKIDEFRDDGCPLFN